VQANLLNETLTTSQRESGYQPAIDVHLIDIKFVLDRIDAVGSDQITVKESEDWKRLSYVHQELINSMKKSKSNILLKDV
jgi:hypothetical protein